MDFISLRELSQTAEQRLLNTGLLGNEIKFIWQGQDMLMQHENNSMLMV